MKILRNILISLVSFLIIAGITGLIILTSIKKSGLPQYEGELSLPGLTDEVTVYRDTRGMPHIYAENEHDLYFVTGYIMAQERLWQMDLIRRVTTGKLSEILGNDYVQTDLFMRSLQMTSKSKMVLSNEETAIIEAMQSYTDGVNAYITEAGGKLQPEFKILSYRPEPWILEDIANIIGYMGWDLASDNLASDIFYYQLLRKYGENASFLIPDWKSTNSVVFPDFLISNELLKDASAFISSMDNLKPLGIASFAGSNNWA
ncbi:MAG TPA: hypothetical protein ENO27_03950, partial [Caldithrix sp.]|nr:hypothetical protein [Caldithrix sp.]